MATTLISASAGTGKTYTICERVVAAITGGLDPARIVATTFTRKAAGELKARLQARLLAEPKLTDERRWALLDRLELAAIGTVHSVGHRFLCRYALELGLSPRLSVLEEETDNVDTSQSRHLGQLLMMQPPACWQSLEELAGRLGIDDAGKTIMALLQAKRSNVLGEPEFRRDLDSSTEEWLAIVGGGQDPARGSQSLADVKALAGKVLPKLQDIAASDATKVTAGAIEAVRQLHIRGVASWGDAANCAGFKAGKASGADALLDPLREFGAAVRHMKAFQDDLRAFMAVAHDAVLELESAYATYKREHGLVDFTDLEVLFLGLLRHPHLKDRLCRDVVLLVVDEFQDTNPLQLAIFQQLRAIAENTIWVGDRKQAIYGFRGTDAELVAQVWDAAPGAAHECLPRNYRSQAGIVNAVNDFFRPQWGKDVEVLADKPAQPEGIERWLLSGKNKDLRYAALAAGIAKLVKDTDIAPGQIAVLVRSNASAKGTAAALDAAGIPCVVPLPGLLATREGAAIHAGIRLTADRRDGAAAAELLQLLVIDPGVVVPQWLGDRLRELNAPDGAVGAIPFAGHPLLDRLTAVPAAALGIADLVLAVQTALDLPGRLAAWGAPERRAANLDALLALAHQYEEECRLDGGAATPGGFARWLSVLAAKNADVQPVPTGMDAVQVLTYFKAKGLEWPVVICCDLDFGRDPNLFSPHVSGGDPSAVNPLAGRTLRWWPWPFGRERQFGGLLDRNSGLLDCALASAFGQEQVAASRSENLRILYVGLTRAKSKLVLAHAGEPGWLNLLGKDAVDALLGPVGGDADGVVTANREWHTSVCRRTLTSADAPPAEAVASTAVWMAGDAATASASYPPRWSNPSSADRVAATIAETVAVPGGSRMAVAGAVASNALGNAVHAYFAALPALTGAVTEKKRDAAEMCLRAWGVAGALPPDNLVAAGDGFWLWLAQRYPGAEFQTEVSVEGARPAGGNWRGTLDVVVLRKGLPIALVDHKTTGHDKGSDHEALFHSGQLQAYRETLAPLEVDTWIHLPLAGKVLKVTPAKQ